MDTLDTISLWISVLICLVGIGALQFRAFGAAARTRSHNNVASFFYIHEIANKIQRNAFSVIALIPLSFIFFVVAYNAETFGKAIVEAYVDNYGKQKIGDIEISGNLLAKIPDPLYPFIILVVSFLVFGAQLKFLYQRIERSVVFATGITHKTNSISWEFATALLEKLSYDQVIGELEKDKKRIPLAEELEDASDELRLSFQLLHLAKSDVMTYGLRGALLKIIDKKFENLFNPEEYQSLAGEQIAEHRRSLLSTVDVNWYHLCSGLVIYMIICGLYIGIVPMVHDFIYFNLAIEWPEYSSIGSLVSGISLMSIATIVPAIVGVVFYATRLTNVDETPIQTLSVVVTAVFVLSVLVNLSFVFAQRTEVFVGLLTGETDEFLGTPEAIYIVLHSVIPCFAVVAIALADPEEILSRLDVILSVSVIGGGHLLCYVAFEVVAGLENGFYWHQGLQGAVLGTAALMILRVFWKPPKGPSGPLWRYTDGVNDGHAAELAGRRDELEG